MTYSNFNTFKNNLCKAVSAGALMTLSMGAINAWGQTVEADIADSG